METLYFWLILSIIALTFALEFIVELLNQSSAGLALPKEFEGFYDAKEYERSQKYLKATTQFSLVKRVFFTLVIVGMILFGGFAWINALALRFNYSPLVTGLLFIGLLSLGSKLLGLPFSIYSTFVIEEKFGFNKATPKVFLVDLIKSIVLAVVIGAPVLAAILWFFESARENAWWICWILVTVVQLFIVFIAPVWIMPLFNKFQPLEDGELKTEIQNFANAQDFKLDGIYKMDGSKRSSKANAYFTGFGKLKRIVLFDTLIEQHTVEELVAVLAHEIGHYKCKHIVQRLLIGILSTGLMFFVLSFFITDESLAKAFGMPEATIYGGLTFFGFLYSPISIVLGIFGNWMSRKHEFEADAFAATKYGKPAIMATALKKLSVKNLSNLTPHPLKVFLDYTHPPVLTRVRALSKFQNQGVS